MGEIIQPGRESIVKSLLMPVRKNNGPEETWMQNISAYEEELKKFREDREQETTKKKPIRRK